MRLTTLLTLFALASATSCRHIEEVPRPPMPGCLTVLPPEERKVELVGPEAGCPPQFVGCLTVDGGLALEHNIKGYRRFAKEAVLRCHSGDAGIP